MKGEYRQAGFTKIRQAGFTNERRVQASRLYKNKARSLPLGPKEKLGPEP